MLLSFQRSTSRPVAHRNLVNHSEHRPWPLPDRPWVMAQTWHDLMFAHWPVPADALRPLVRPPLELETFEGSAWIGVVPFWMTGLRPRAMPALPRLSRAIELNVRTYVRYADKPGVLFLSLDISQWPAVFAARKLFHLPYYRARMSLRRSVRSKRDVIDYASRRVHTGPPRAEFRAAYGPTGSEFCSIQGTLEHFLTERYCLYTFDPAGRLLRVDIHHLPWPLQPADAEFEVNTMAASHGVPLPESRPLMHFARRLRVIVWWPVDVL